MVQAAKETEGLGLEYLGKLTFFDDSFEYDQKSYEYKEIAHIEYTAVQTRHSVNFVPTGTSYSATLFLHLNDGRRLQIKQERVLFGRKEKERSEAVMRAAAMLMSVTFNQRIEVYEAQLARKGFVSWGNYQINKEGDLFFKNELRFNIRRDDISCRLGPFHLECSKRKPRTIERLKALWSGSAEVIDITVDKDCFVYIMSRYLGLTWQGQAVPEKRKTGRQLFHEALLTLGGKLCKADGQVSPEEIGVFKEYFGIDESTFPGAGKIFMEATKTAEDARPAANRIFSLFDGKKEPLEYILVHDLHPLKALVNVG
jgi:hypothetical protein